jgi:hypothetical protein
LRGGERLGKHLPLPTQLPMGLWIKNRQNQTAEICKQRLREKYPDKLGLVEEFIVEIEGPPNNCDVTRWGKFTGIRDIKKKMLNSKTGSIRETAD